MNKGITRKISFLIMGLIFVFAGYSLSIKGTTEQNMPEESKPLTIGLSMSSLHSNFMVALVHGAEASAKEHGNIRLIVANANFDAATQFNQLEDLITQKPDAIILNALDGEGTIPAVIHANRNGIPVFTLDLGTNGGNIESFIETDNISVGREAAQFIAEKLKARYGIYTGNVVDLMGASGMSSTRNREKGFEEQMAKYPGVKIIIRQATDLDQEKSLNIMTNILQGHGQIDAVFCANDSAAMGASRAIQQMGRFFPVGHKQHIVICGVDGNGPVLEEIRQGKIDGTISQHPVKMADKVIDYTVDLLRDNKVPPKHEYYPHILITRENIDSSYVKEYGIWSEFIP